MPQGVPPSHGAWFYSLHGQLTRVRPKRSVVVTKLTQTFRFGAEIGAVANGILCVKEHSEQTCRAAGVGSKPVWVPYRIRPVGHSGEVLGREESDTLKMPYTVAARTKYAPVRT